MKHRGIFSYSKPIAEKHITEKSFNGAILEYVEFYRIDSCGLEQIFMHGVLLRKIECSFAFRIIVFTETFEEATHHEGLFINDVTFLGVVLIVRNTLGGSKTKIKLSKKCHVSLEWPPITE